MRGSRDRLGGSRAGHGSRRRGGRGGCGRRRGRDRGGGRRGHGRGGGRARDGRDHDGRGVAVDAVPARDLHAHQTARRDAGRRGGDQVVEVYQVIVAVGEHATLVLRGIAGLHPLDEHDAERRVVTEVDRHGPVGRDAVARDRERPIDVERREGRVRGHGAGRGEDPPGAGGGAGHVAAGDEGEGQNDSLHGISSEGTVGRLAIDGSPGVRVFEGHRVLCASKTRPRRISHDWR